MRLGIGGRAFGVRGGISTRGVGVGVGPISAGTSWRRGRRRKSSGDGSTTIVFLVAAALVFFAVAWPYFFGTFVAVGFGADNPSTTRTVVGWIFEAFYIICIIGLIAYFVLTQEQRAQQAAEQAQRHAQEAAERAQKHRELVASGVVYHAQHGRSLVYRHGTCTMNHRSHETAARCRNG
jgi:lysylphosphatidylglycerol synthetase-like protein (DUF2156 family)